ncbi:hypothetical protein [Sphingomonas alpina]|uniref:Uncharacterized protein n=1 Tax=Sphingomonas alpina TaxID=653931 RepID=A0A7H0LGS3_9SPHN|nr:hypothetical protein [Sphingomonas alpina]QNQ08876.1 hypothetical protein H3Z74_19520 [Sphingomonas alpina]
MAVNVIIDMTLKVDQPDSTSLPIMAASSRTGRHDIPPRSFALLENKDWFRACCSGAEQQSSMLFCAVPMLLLNNSTDRVQAVENRSVILAENPT